MRSKFQPMKTITQLIDDTFRNEGTKLIEDMFYLIKKTCLTRQVLRPPVYLNS